MEIWALRVLDQLSSPSGLEDQNVELKRELPEPADGARLIAGLCNAARGDPVMILVGVDEAARSVVGAPAIDLHNWWDAATQRFDGIHPSLLDVLVSTDEELTVHALVFDGESSSAPYVVKNASGGPISHEVPWREGTRLRSARRVDLLRVLVPAISVPEVKVLDGYLLANYVTDRVPEHLDWHFRMDLYLTPRGDATLTYPRHRCSATATIQEVGAQVTFPWLRFTYHRQHEGMAPGYLTITPGEAIIEGPCRFQLYGMTDSDVGGFVPEGDVEINVVLHPSLVDAPVVLTQRFSRRPSTRRWGVWAHEANREDW